MNEHIEQAWTDGFTKAANEAGITDPEEVTQLLVLAKRAQLAAGHMDAYEEGVAKAAAEAGLEKEAILPLLMGMGGAIGGAIGLARWRNKGQRWNQMDAKDMAAGTKAYESKGLLGKGWAHLTNPAMIQAVRDQRAAGTQALAREQSGDQYAAFGRQKQREFQNKADAWGGGGSQSRGRPGGYYGQHYRRRF